MMDARRGGRPRRPFADARARARVLSCPLPLRIHVKVANLTSPRVLFGATLSSLVLLACPCYRGRLPITEKTTPESRVEEASHPLARSSRASFR